jgi:hypothetical protein
VFGWGDRVGMGVPWGVWECFENIKIVPIDYSWRDREPFGQKCP